MSDRVFNGEIRQGFGRYRLRERDRDGAVEVVKKKRMHRFGSGYEDRGRWRPLTHVLSNKDASAVRDLLDDWLGDDRDELIHMFAGEIEGTVAMLKGEAEELENDASREDVIEQMLHQANELEAVLNGLYYEESTPNDTKSGGSK